MQNEFEKYVGQNLSHIGLTADQMIKQIVENSLTPYILEERELRVTQMDIFSRLMADRIIWIAGAIDDNTSSIVQAQLLFLESLDKTKEVSLYIDSPGGSVKSGLSIIDSMDNATFDISTVNTGMCASMGSVLLAAGTKGKRSSLRFSKVMTHQVSHGTNGNIQDTRIGQKEAEKYNYILFQLLGKYSGKTWKEVLEFSKRDRWLTSDEAKNYGLVDEVILKEGSESITDLLKGFDEYIKYVEGDE
jgi:ATP-dependent Clp protease protease subunit